MSNLFLASMDSRHFSFDALGRTPADAVNTLIQGLRSHAGQCEIEPDWWYDDAMKAAADDGKPRVHIEEPLRLIDDGLIQVRELELGQAYRDGSVLPFVPVDMDNAAKTKRKAQKPDSVDEPTRIYQCGICDHYHRAAFKGDCRNDKERFTIEQVEDFFGNEGTGWIEVPMAEAD